MQQHSVAVVDINEISFWVVGYFWGDVLAYRVKLGERRICQVSQAEEFQDSLGLIQIIYDVITQPSGETMMIFGFFYAYKSLCRISMKLCNSKFIAVLRLASSLAKSGFS